MGSDTKKLYLAEQTRELDRRMIAAGVSGLELMKRAGYAVFRCLLDNFANAQRLLVICGGGNNGGDGYIVAQLAATSKLEVEVMALAEPGSADAQQARALWLNDGHTIEPADATRLHSTDLVIDAMFGTGLSRPPSQSYAAIIKAVNQSAAAVIAVDLPSGLNGDTGSTPGACIDADMTVTFIGRKLGLYTGRGPDFSGRIVFESLGLSRDVISQIDSAATTIATPIFKSPQRCRHKGDAGRLLIAGGDHGMVGAVILSGEAALRSGAGLVSVLSHAATAASIVAWRPELLTLDTADVATMNNRLAHCDALVLGPGLGQGQWGRALFDRVVACQQPLVIDADALNLLAQTKLKRDHWVLTPHPGEAARLLHTSIAAVEADRPAAAQAISRLYSGCCVLKGCGSLVSSAQDLWLCDRGNPGMASAGMGDVLSGIIGALMAAGRSPLEAAKTGVWLHATAADRALQNRGPFGLLASDLALETAQLMAENQHA